MSTPSNKKAHAKQSEWYYQLLGLATGPVTLERLKWLLENDHLTAESLVGPGENGPWQRLDESPLASLVKKEAAPKTADKKKAVRISSGRKASSRNLPTVKKESPQRPEKSVGLNEDGYVTDGIEIDETVEELHLPEPPSKTPASKSKTVKPSASTKPSAASPVYDELEVVSGRDARKTAQERKTEQLKWYLQVGGAMVGVLLVVLLGAWAFSTKADPVGDAYECFTDAAAGIERNSIAMNDIHWNQWVKDTRVEVALKLEPLREHANASDPKAQSLVWAGEELLRMLAGARVIPDEMTAKFENYMADFAEAPMTDGAVPKPPGDIGSAEAKKNSISDPVFAQ